MNEKWVAVETKEVGMADEFVGILNDQLYDSEHQAEQAVAFAQKSNGVGVNKHSYLIIRLYQ